MIKVQSFKCAVCNGAAAVVGFYCLCDGGNLGFTNASSMQPEIAALVVYMPEQSHTTESAIVREIALRPVPAITTASVTLTPNTGSIRIG